MFSFDGSFFPRELEFFSPTGPAWASNLTRAALLTPFALPQLGEVRQLWQGHRRKVIGVAILCPLSYILVLTALSFSPVSDVAPAREISIVIGAAMGTQLLAATVYTQVEPSFV